MLTLKDFFSAKMLTLKDFFLHSSKLYMTGSKGGNGQNALKSQKLVPLSLSFLMCPQAQLVLLPFSPSSYSFH